MAVATWDEVRLQLEQDWALWLAALLPAYATAPFGPHHEQFWDWVWGIELGEPSPPFVGIWPRGGAKSTSAEAACVALGARSRRRYGLYVSESQDQADKHVENVGAILESAELGAIYPGMSDRLVDKYGSSKGWRRNRLRTRTGFTIDAIGLDKGTRGLKVQDQRPDFIVLDDIDDHTDTIVTVGKKVDLITKRILPAGSPDAIVLAIQNLVHPTGVFARLANLAPPDSIPSDFLVGRILSGPLPALVGAAYDHNEDGEWVITAGRATWAGQDVEACQAFMDREGYTAFRSECQHEVEPATGGMYDDVEWAHCRFDELPSLVTVAVWVDPAVTNTDRSDSHAMQCDGLGVDDRLYRLASWEERSSPLDSLKRAIATARRFGATRIGVETDNGRDTWATVYEQAWREYVDENGWPPGLGRPTYAQAQAGSSQMSKAERSSRMLADYQRPGRQIVHVTTGPDGEVGTHDVLERALRRFPRSKPFDLADAAYWAWKDLRANKVAPAAPVGIGRSTATPWASMSRGSTSFASRPWR